VTNNGDVPIRDFAIEVEGPSSHAGFELSPSIGLSGKGCASHMMHITYDFDRDLSIIGPGQTRDLLDLEYVRGNGYMSQKAFRALAEKQLRVVFHCNNLKPLEVVSLMGHIPSAQTTKISWLHLGGREGAKMGDPIW
jgi:hypothetical protein